MKQKIFLTSVIAMGFVAPAMAEPSNTDTFPQDGLMQEDYTYTNAATSTNMAGVYEGTVDAVAQYTDNLYQLVAGQYLPANSETPIDCDQNGYFCPGDNNGVYYSSSAQGLTQCPSGYGYSGTGASANTDCYRMCTNADVAHSTGTMNGGYYYGDNNQCEPTGCENGWHVKEGAVDLTVLRDVNYVSRGALKGSGSFWGDNNAAYYHIDTPMSFGIDFGEGYGIIVGHGVCSSTYAGYGATRDTIALDNRENCWCKIDKYIVNNIEKNVSGPYVIYNGLSNPSNCLDHCSEYCTSSLGLKSSSGGSDTARSKVFDLFGDHLATCEANTITINWDGASATEINANNAGTATYGSDIRTPRSATPVPGKTFTGWRFSAPQQASVEPQGD